MRKRDDSKPLPPSFTFLVRSLIGLTARSGHPAMMAALLRMVRRLLDAQGVAIVFSGSDDCFWASRTDPPGWHARCWPLMTSVSAWAMRERQAAVIGDLASDARIPPAQRVSPLVRSMVMVPVGGDAPFAAIGVYWARSGRPDAAAVATVRALSGVTALLLARPGEATLAAPAPGAEHYRALAMASSHALFRLDPSMHELRAIDGSDPAILAACRDGAWLDTLVCSEDRDRAMRACAEARRDAALLEIELRVRLAAAGSGWLALRAVPVLAADGAVTGWLGMASDISARKQTEETLWWRANFDVLTGLPNRGLFRDRLDHEIRKVQRSARTLALLFIDLDRFKEVNDLLGHAVGDRLLTEAAQRIQACVRQSDTVARLGGDEFTAILTNLDEVSHVETTAQKIIDALLRPFQLDEEQVYLSASVGITLYATDADNAEDLIRNADQAMYAAKNAGRNQFSYFTPSMQQRAHQRLRLISDLRSALHHGQLEVHFQPVVSLASGCISKAEALLRWRHPRHGLIEPTLFIPYAEESGLINEIGDWVFEQAAHCSQRWSRQLGRPFQIGVNRSPVQFRSNAAQLNWSGYLNRLGLPGNSITVEITEGVLLHASSNVTDSLVQYRNAGIEVAIDDFGSGYSSMAYLKKFHIDYLKIDQSFIHDMAINTADRAIVKAMIVMAHELDLRVVAEGIETREQQRLLTAAGCDFGQGFLFARAMPAFEFESRLSLHH